MAAKILSRLRALIPKPLRRFFLKHTRRPAVGRVGFGDLRRLDPISRSWGGDRGTPIDRFYIESFLSDNAADIQGRVLEIGNNRYTKRFGERRVLQSEVLDIVRGSTKVTIVGDLAHAPQIDGNTFDCVVCTQTLQLIPDCRAAIATLHRILRPGGVLLATVPALSQLYIPEGVAFHDHWRFTSWGSKELLAGSFPTPGVSVRAFGNLLTAASFLYGLAAEDLSVEELEQFDPRYEMLIGVRAMKTPLDDGTRDST